MSHNATASLETAQALEKPTGLLHWLTRAHPQFIRTEDRHRAQLLAAMLLVTELGGLLVMLVAGLNDVTVLNDSDWIAAQTAWIITLGLYGANRRGHTTFAAAAFIALLFVLFISIPYVPDGVPSTLAFAIIPILLTGIFFRLREVLVVALATVTLTGVLNMFIPEQPGSYRQLWQFLLFSAPVIATFIHHLNAVEIIRRQALERANEKLRQSEASLERRVQARTRDLQVAADVSRKINSLLDLDILLPDLVERTRAAFDLYQVSVFLYDPKDERLNYEAGTGDAGQRMKASGKFFGLSEAQGLVPNAALRREALLINDVTQSNDHFRNPYLPETRAELVLPMLMGQQLIGVMDLQAKQVNRFTNDDVRVFTTLADQIAVAVNNAHLYAEQVRAAEELRAIDNLKSQFLASMSHELRTPLNAILNFTEFVSLGMVGSVNDQQRDLLNKSINSGRHLLSLINDVLDITKIESGMMNLFVEEEIDLRPEIEAVVATAETLLQGKPVDLQVEMDDALVLAAGDKRRIKQVLLNLVSNACKFTEQGQITIQAKNHGDSLQFAVIDTGPGIAKVDQALIFEPFQQTETGIRHANGTGLGLPISKRLVEAHGGQLSIESESGSGAAFYVNLPKHSDLRTDHSVSANA